MCLSYYRAGGHHIRHSLMGRGVKSTLMNGVSRQGKALAIIMAMVDMQMDTILGHIGKPNGSSLLIGTVEFIVGVPLLNEVSFSLQLLSSDNSYRIKKAGMFLRPDYSASPHPILIRPSRASKELADGGLI
jgi:hypothetical protein